MCLIRVCLIPNRAFVARWSEPVVLDESVRRRGAARAVAEEKRTREFYAGRFRMRRLDRRVRLL